MSPSSEGFPDIRPRAVKPASAWDQARYADALKCNRCGFCTSYCPTYLATGDEALSPRGRNQVFRALMEGRLADPDQATRAFSTCLLCGICTSVCFSEVPTAGLMSAAREKVLQARGAPFFLRLLLRRLLPRPRFLEAALHLLFLGKRLGFSRFLNRLGILRRLSPRLAAADDMTERLPGRFLRSRLAPAPADAQALQFLACGPNYLLPETGLATARLLDGAGVRHGCAPNLCCGLPAVSYGDLDAARALAQSNIEALERHPSAVVLLDDSSCAAAVKDWPALFEQDPAWLPRARAVAARTKDLSEWLLSLSRSPVPPPDRPGRIAYHDPCKARYAQKIVDPPRRILAAVPGLRLIEIPEADQCCGGGGVYSVMHPDLSRRVLERKIGHILSTGAEEVLTSSISCLLQVRSGLARAGSPVRVRHLAEFLADGGDRAPLAQDSQNL